MTASIGDRPLSVVMPAFNEEATLAQVVGQVLAVPGLLELIVVDDCSTDRTPGIATALAAADPRIRYLRQARNLGKTAALKRGFAMTRGDIVIVQDADLEYDPAEIADVIAPIVAGRADVVYGSRFLVKRATRVLYFYHYLANKVLTFASNCLTNLNMTDVETGYKAFRGEVIRNMIITSSHFGFEIEVTAKVAKLGCVVYEVPISYHGRTYAEGKKIAFGDGIPIRWYCFALPIAALCVVQCALFVVWGRFPVNDGGSVLGHLPLTGFTNALPRSLLHARGVARIQIVAWAFVVVASLGFAWRLFRTRARSWEVVAFVLYGALMASVGPSVWAEDIAFLRVFTHCYVFGSVLLLASTFDALAAFLALAAAGTWVVEFGRMVRQS